MSTDQLANQRPIVITGASAGIGKAAAISLAKAGFPVILGARRVAKLAELAAEINAAGGQAKYAELDVTNPESLANFVGFAGVVSGVVLNAGGASPGEIQHATATEFARIIELNLLATQQVLAGFAPQLVAAGFGDLVFISSDVAVTARPYTSAYSASKWGLEGMVKSLQMELEGTGVRASIVRPGPTHSEFGHDWPAEPTGQALLAWERFGLARHSDFLPASAIGDAVTQIINAPAGVHLSLIEVNPTPPRSNK